MGIEILNSISAISALYKQTGTNYGDGIRSGNFKLTQGTRTVAPGVDTMDLQFYSPGVTSNTPATPIITYTVGAGAAGQFYLPLSLLANRFSYDYDIDNTKLVSVGIISYTRQPDGTLTPLTTSRNYCERIIQLSCNQPFTNFVISGYTMYDEKVVYSGNSTLLDALNVSSPFGDPIAAISSISFVATPPFTMNLFVRGGMGLPYTDWGNSSNLILFSATGTTANIKPFVFGIFNPNINILRSNYQYTAGNQGTGSGSRRPYIATLPTGTGWQGGTQMFSIQNINPGIFNPNDPNGNSTYSPSNYNSVDLSDVKTLRGPTPYSDGWTDWQG